MGCRRGNPLPQLLSISKFSLFAGFSTDSDRLATTPFLDTTLVNAPVVDNPAAQGTGSAS